MDGGRIAVDELQRRGDTMKAPFDCFGTQALPFNMPAQWSHPLCDDVDGGLGLDHVQRSDNAWVSQGAQLPHGIFGQGQPRLVWVNLEGKDAAG